MPVKGLELSKYRLFNALTTATAQAKATAQSDHSISETKLCGRGGSRTARTCIARLVWDIISTLR